MSRAQVPEEVNTRDVLTERRRIQARHGGLLVTVDAELVSK